MPIREILNTTEHRPWRIPNVNWKFYQEWNKVLFLHWQVKLNELQKFVPKELEIDLFEGKPWISLVVFKMEKIRPKNLPALSLISDFDEINIRTYVKSNAKTGVYFLSIESGTYLSGKLAKWISALPYRYSKITRETNQCRSTNTEYNDELNFRFMVGNKIEQKDPLDNWLTERYALFQDSGNLINIFEIHHLEWPLREIQIANLKLNYPKYANLINTKPDKIHYSDGVKVLAWGKQRHDKSASKRFEHDNDSSIISC